MHYLWLAGAVLSSIVLLAILLLPAAAIVASRRERAGAPCARLTTGNVLIASGVSFLVTPFLAATITPDFNPLTILALAGAGWASAGFSAVYIWSYRRGISASRAALQAIAAALVAPVLGMCGVIGGKFGSVF